MFKILRKTVQTGLVTIGYPNSPAKLSPRYRGAPRFDFANLNDPRAAADACPTDAISIVEVDDRGHVTMDYGRCIFCGQCAEADSSIQMTQEFELAARHRSDLVVNAELLGGLAGVLTFVAGIALDAKRNGCQIDV